MRLTRAQGVVITLLNIVIVALVAVIMFVPHSFWDRLTGASAGEEQPTEQPDEPTPDEPTPDEPVHNKFREASGGAVPGIVRETKLMGLGDETAVEVFFRGGATYIFGNATVKGLDFDSYGGFMCVIDGAGKICSYSYTADKLTAACMLGDGFAAVAGDDLYYASASGEMRKVALMSSGAAVDIFAADNSAVAVISQPTQTSLRFTEYVMTEGEWTLGHATRIDSGYTLKYLDCYKFLDSYVIAARAYSLPRYDSLVMYSFQPGGDATDYNYGGTAENMTRPYDIMPCADGYITLASKNGVATVINIDYSFTVYRSQSLGFTFSDARLVYTDGKYYAGFDRPDGAVTYEVGDAVRKKISFLDGIAIDCAIKADAVYFAGRVGDLTSLSSDKNKIALNIVTESGRAVCFGIKNAVVYAATECADGLTLVLSAEGGEALSGAVAGRDIYIITVSKEYIIGA